MHVISLSRSVTVELITNILIEYLKHNKRLVVPRLGAFIVKQPSGVILFSDLMRGDDGVLRSLLMAYGVKELEANGMIDRLVFDIHHAINRGESYVIDNFGEFVASDNNSITFHHKREPQVFGGNIKPPVETLSIERERLQRMEAARSAHSRESRAAQRPRRSVARSAKEDDMMHMGRPEAYLRGLKYDNSKNKKRGEEQMETKHRRRPSPAVVLIIAIVIGGMIWGGWQWHESNDTHAERAAVVAATTADALTGADITIDTAAIAKPMAERVSDNDVTM